MSAPQEFLGLRSLKIDVRRRAILSLNQLIKAKFKEAPYGWFVLKVTLADQFNLQADSRTFLLSQAYHEDFTNLEEVMEIHGGEFSSITTPNNGCELETELKREVLSLRISSRILTSKQTSQYQDGSR